MHKYSAKMASERPLQFNNAAAGLECNGSITRRYEQYPMQLILHPPTPHPHLPPSEPLIKI